jgi:hypothetical protein
VSSSAIGSGHQFHAPAGMQQTSSNTMYNRLFMDAVECVEYMSFIIFAQTEIYDSVDGERYLIV